MRSSLSESKISRSKDPNTIQNNDQIFKKLDDARKSYYEKMDRSSLENYQDMQLVMDQIQMNQSYL